MVLHYGFLSLQQETILHSLQQPAPATSHHQLDPAIPAIRLRRRCPWSLRHRTQRRSEKPHGQLFEMGLRRSRRCTVSPYMSSLCLAQGEELVGIRLGLGPVVSVSPVE